MTPTTMASIIAASTATIEALIPDRLPETRLRIAPRQDQQLRETAQRIGSASFRWFEVTRSSGRSDNALMDPSATRMTAAFTVLVAYPVMPALYGRLDLDDLEALVESDARQIADALQSPSHLAASGHNASTPIVEETDRALDHVWFQAIRLTATYYVAQSL